MQCLILDLCRLFVGGELHIPVMTVFQIYSDITVSPHLDRRCDSPVAVYGEPGGNSVQVSDLPITGRTVFLLPMAGVNTD